MMFGGVHRLLATLTARELVTEAIDILIVYYLIYRALLLIKGTRGAQMLIGLALVVGGFFLAKQLELATLSWLLDHFFHYFILLVIVVFQHDIRRALVRIGRNLFSSTRVYEETNIIEEVLQAAAQLAKNRVGGLIVLERDAEVTEFLELGIEVDAKVSKELLVSLFLPHRENVMHDGAVIVKNLRIAQAGAVLPLSANPKLEKSLGTRHRAAIGITEETDAVAVVVSEERGIVSLCYHGNIVRDLDSATLRKALLSLFYREKRTGKAKPKKAPEEPVTAAAGSPTAGELPTGGQGTESP